MHRPSPEGSGGGRPLADLHDDFLSDGKVQRDVRIDKHRLDSGVP